MHNIQYRQGDVFLVRVSNLPAGATLVPRDDKGRVVLAVGEATGHAHAIAAPGVDLFEAAGRTYLSVGGDCVTLLHEEHLPISIPPGDFEVIRQVEYTPAAIRRVMD